MQQPPPRLRHRPVRRSDVDECLALLPDYLGFDAAQRERAGQWWLRHVDEPACISAVFEDVALPRGQRIQGWGVSMVASPALVDEMRLLDGPSAYLTRRIYDALIDGRHALPDDRTIGRLNAAGEAVLAILHFTVKRPDSDPYAHKVVAMANDSFRSFHDGYQWRAMVYENLATFTPMATGSGFVAMPFRDAETVAALPPEQRPALFGLTREQARRQAPGTIARNCFESQPPRFRLSTSQRRLLWNALFDESDESLGALLEVSANGLKKLWRGIYERIEAVDPEFFGDAGPGSDEGKRGPEKRRQVLAYVRQRLEELRPWNP